MEPTSGISLNHIDIIDNDMARIIRAKSPGDRLRIASGMFSSARRILLGHLHSEHPDWDEKRVMREAARRLSHGAF